MPALNSSRGSALLPSTLSLLALALSATVSAQSAVTGMAVPPLLAKATVTGRVTPATVLNLSISLKPRDRAGMQVMANRVSNPQSADYHRFLTPAQIGERYGASVDTVNATVAYLKSKGMTVTLVANNRMAILFKGRADKVESAFSTKLMNFQAAQRMDGGPSKFFSFTAVPKVPAKIASSVIAIGGLQNAYRPAKRSTLTPSQTRQLYSAANLYSTGHKGEGINVGITNFDGYRLSNLPLLYSSFGLTPPDGGVGSNVTKVSVDGFDGETATAQAEGDLDIQLVLAVAPRCNLYVYDSNDFVATAVRQANDDVVDIVSESWGHLTNESTRAAIVAAHDQHVAMTLQGITYLLATGDYGTDLLGFDYPNFDPEILQVGGSVATVDGVGNRVSEVGWDGSGAGWSGFDVAFNTLPSWLKGTTVPTNVNRRIFPDVALHAFGGTSEGYNFVFNGAVSAVSGTSASSPTFAGQLALLLQTLSEQDSADISGSGRPRLGRLQDFIYSLDGNSPAFLDLLGGDAGQLLDGDQAVGKAGWDYVTGWGAPNLDELLNETLVLSSVALPNEATDVAVFHPSSPNIVFGTSVQGGVESLPAQDGVAYSVVSVSQKGVGQVAAATVGFNLTGDPAKRRSLDLKVALSSPSLTTGYVYLYNYQTGQYDLMKTLTGSGTTKSVTITSVEIAKYVNGSAIEVLVRGLKPTRLGSTPFRLSVDQTLAIERVSRS